MLNVALDCDSCRFLLMSSHGGSPRVSPILEIVGEDEPNGHIIDFYKLSKSLAVSVVHLVLDTPSEEW